MRYFLLIENTSIQRGLKRFPTGEEQRVCRLRRRMLQLRLTAEHSATSRALLSNKLKINIVFAQTSMVAFMVISVVKSLPSDKEIPCSIPGSAVDFFLFVFFFSFVVYFYVFFFFFFVVVFFLVFFFFVVFFFFFF